IHNPAQSAQRDLAVGFARPLAPIHRAEHPVQHLTHVFVCPLARRARHIVDGFGRRDVGPAKPDIHSHPLILNCSWRADAVVTGCWQVNWWQTYAAAAPSTDRIPSMNGSRAASALCRPRVASMVTVNGSYRIARA